MSNDIQIVNQLESKFKANQLEMDIRLQQEQFKQLDRMLSLRAAERNFGSAGPQEVLEGLYAPEDYVDISAYRRDNYGYQAYASTFTTKTDRKDGRNWPYWVSEPELAAIRGTVRLLAAYNKTIIGVLSKLRNYVIADGLTRKIVNIKKNAPDELVTKIERVLDQFDEYNEITGSMDQEAFIRDVRDGEIYLGLWHRGEGHVDLRVVEPDQVSEPTNKNDLEEWLRSTDSDESGLPFVSNWSFGIHTTEGDVCAKHGYYVQWDGKPDNWDYMPGGNRPCYPPTGSHSWLEMRKSNTDRNIKRGVSDFWPISGDVELARKMIRNMTHAGALQCAIAWIKEMQPGQTQSAVQSATMAMADWQTNTTTQNGSRQTYQYTYNPGTTLSVPWGYKFTPPPWAHQGVTAGIVTIFEAMLRTIASIWSMPEHMVTGSAANNNYASILEAGSPFVKEAEARQSWHTRLWKRIYWKVLWFNWRAGVFGNKYTWEDIKVAVDLLLEGPQVDVRDRMMETSRNNLLLSAGILSKTTFAAREGLDYDEQVEQGAGQPEQPEMDPGMDQGMDQGQPAQLPPDEELSNLLQQQLEVPDQQQGEQPEVMDEPSSDDGTQAIDPQEGLNGAQIIAAVGLLKEVSAGSIAPPAALKLLIALGMSEEDANQTIDSQAKISIDREQAEKVVGDVVPDQPAQPVQEAEYNPKVTPGLELKKSATDNNWDGSFTHSGKNYSVSAVHNDPGTLGSEFELQFSQDHNGLSRYDTTGDTGNAAIGVFRKIGFGVDNWIKKERPRMIYFAAEGHSRAKLYHRLAGLLAKRHNYKLSTKTFNYNPQYFGSNNQYTEFYLTRNDDATESNYELESFYEAFDREVANAVDVLDSLDQLDPMIGSCDDRWRNYP